MTEIRRADPTARRNALLIVTAGAVLGVLLFAAIEQYRVALRDWILAEQEESSWRLRLVFLSGIALLLVPLMVFAAYLWSLGRRVLEARAFPPPGLRVIRDTAVVTGEVAASRGRRLKLLALCCAAGCIAVGRLLWRHAP